MSAPQELQPLTMPPCQRKLVDKVRCSAERLSRVRKLTRAMRIVRPNGESPAGAFIDAVAEGLIICRRADDPEGREFCVKAGGGAAPATGMSPRPELRRKKKKWWWQND